MKRPTRSVPVALFVGDLVVFTVFAVWGRVSHNMELTVSGVAETGVPFWLTWTVLAALLGGYRSRAVRTPARAALYTAGLWLAACPLAAWLRSFYLQTPIIPAFVAVTFGLVLVLLVLWRAFFAKLTQRRPRW